MIEHRELPETATTSQTNYYVIVLAMLSKSSAVSRDLVERLAGSLQARAR